MCGFLGGSKFGTSFPFQERKKNPRVTFTTPNKCQGLSESWMFSDEKKTFRSFSFQIELFYKKTLSNLIYEVYKKDRGFVLFLSW